MAAAAALLGSVASKTMSRAAAADPSPVARGLQRLHGSGLAAATCNQQSGTTADVSLMSASMAAATTKMIAHAPPPYHRLVHGRGIHSSRTSSPEKIVDALETATTYVTIAMAFGAAYLHFWYRPKLREVKEEYRQQLSQIKKIKQEIKGDDDHVKELKATIMDHLEAENAKLKIKIALDSAR